MVNENADAVVASLFNSLPEQMLQVILHIQRLMPYPKQATRKSLASKLHKYYPDYYRDQKSAERFVAQAWEAAKRQGVVINDREMLLIHRNKSRYSGNLRYILLQLRPQLDKQRIIEWEQLLCRGENLPPAH